MIHQCTRIFEVGSEAEMSAKIMNGLLAYWNFGRLKGREIPIYVLGPSLWRPVRATA